MTVATDIQTIMGRVSAAIAANEKMGRVELEKLRRELEIAYREARDEDRRQVTRRIAFDELVTATERGVVNLQGVVDRVRRQAALHATPSPSDADGDAGAVQS